MPVDTKHPDYALMRPKWDRMRAVCAGQDAIHEGQEAYLPRLSGETDADYKARIARTAFFEATWRTIEGLRGMLFRKPPVVVVSTAAESMLSDVTKSGVDLETLAMGLTDEVLTVNRVGLMEDYPPVPQRADGRAPTVAEFEAMNLRPNMAVYAAESIINWRYEWRGNRHMLVMVDLEETAQIPKENDRFSFTEEKRWRVLELDANGEYCVTVYKKDGGQDVIVSGPDYPMRAGKRLRKIPFQIIDTSGKKGTVDLPPLLGLANLNISHYQTTADLEHGAHKTALPQPWIAGLTQQMDANGRPIPVTLYMGGGTAWTMPMGAEAGMLEYTGRGLDALEKRREAKERQMAIMGARMLEDQKAGVEAAETAGIHRSGEQSALAAIGSAISKGIAEGLAEFDLWAGGDGNVEFKLNDEFFPATLSAQDVTALVGAWQVGGLSHQELFEKFQKGGVVRDGKKYDEHETEITTNPPMLTAPIVPQDEELAE